MVRFHVVNSVKGGCGKSTFSLYLANYLTVQGHKAVIIDLDIGGSTWYREFKPHLVNEITKSSKNMDDFSIEETKFLNDLFYEYEKNKTRKHVFELNIQDVVYRQVINNGDQVAESNNQKTENEKQTGEEEKPKHEIIEGDKRKINIIMTDPERASCIRDEELDLLEDAICSLADEIAVYTYPYDTDAVIDLIFDMPPGYEEHSEHILMHALMDLGSDLYKKYTSEKDKNGKYKNPVYLYMMSVVKQSALEANIQYVEHFYRSSSYSMDVGVLNTKNVFFILNDSDASYNQFIEIEKLILQNEGRSLIENIRKSEKINQTKIQAYFIKHLHIYMSKPAYDNLLKGRNDYIPSPYYLIEETDGFTDTFKEMKHLTDT